MRFAPLQINNVTHCAAETDAATARYMRLKLELKERDRSLSSSTSGNSSSVSVAAQETSASNASHRMLSDLARFVELVDLRCAEIDIFLKQHHNDARVLLFEKQRNKLAKIVSDFRLEWGHILNSQPQPSRERDRSSMAEPGSYHEHHHPNLLEDPSNPGGGGPLISARGFQSMLQQQQQRQMASPRPRSAAHALRKEPRLAYSVPQAHHDPLLDSSASRHVKPIYDWEQQQQQQQQQQARQGQSSRSMADLSSQDFRDTGGVQQQPAFIAHDMFVRLTLDELNMLRQEFQLRQDSLTPRFLKKGSGHLAYTHTVPEEPFQQEVQRLFLTSRGPYREPIISFKHEDRAKWVAGEFKTTGFARLPRNGSPELPAYINAGLPYTSGNPEMYKLMLRDVVPGSAGVGACVGAGAGVEAPRSARRFQSPPSSDRAGASPRREFVAVTRNVSGKSHVDKLLPIGAYSK